MGISSQRTKVFTQRQIFAAVVVDLINGHGGAFDRITASASQKRQHTPAQLSDAFITREDTSKK